MRIRRRVGPALVGLVAIMALPVVPALADDTPRPVVDSGPGAAEPVLDVIASATTPTVGAPGGPVSFDVAVTNTSGAGVTLTSLTSSIDGGPAFSLQSVGGPITLTICAPAPVAAGATFTCNFTATVTGGVGDTVTHVVSATAVDGDGNVVRGSNGTGTAVAVTADPALRGESITPVVLGASGALPSSGGSFPWGAVATAVGLVVGACLVRGEMGPMAHGRRLRRAVPSNRAWR